MAGGVRKCRSGARYASATTTISLYLALLLLPCITVAQSIRHMQRRTPRTLVPKGLDSTQSGAGLADSGFQLAPGEQKILSVFENWHGRVWGRTNCWFNEDGTKPSDGSPGKAWGLGDCSGVLNWKVSKDVSGTHTEFTFHAGDGRMYNIPMVIEIEPHGNSSLDGLPPNITNLACMGAFGRLAPQSSPPSANDQTFWGTNASYPLSLDSKLDSNTVVKWCPRNWQVNIPKPPNDGMYTYPNNSIQRLAFNPCYSACTERNLAQNYYTSHQNYPSTCQLSEYSKAAKAICLDGYSYAFDDRTSTFIIRCGAGFNIISYPSGRSSNILTAESHNVSFASGYQVGFIDSGDSNNEDNMVARDCHDITTNRHTDGCEPRSYKKGADDDGIAKLDGLKKRKEYDRTGEKQLDEPIPCAQVVGLVKRGMHLRDWERKRRQELEAQSASSRAISVLWMKSSATAVAAPGEMKSTTWYLMGAGLFVTAGVFMML